MPSRLMSSPSSCSLDNRAKGLKIRSLLVDGRRDREEFPQAKRAVRRRGEKELVVDGVEVERGDPRENKEERGRSTNECVPEASSCARTCY